MNQSKLTIKLVCELLGVYLKLCVCVCRLFLPRIRAVLRATHSELYKLTEVQHVHCVYQAHSLFVFGMFFQTTKNYLCTCIQGNKKVMHVIII